MSRGAFALGLALALFGCRSAPVAWTPLAADDPRPALRVAALQALAQERHALRATGRVEAEGPAGSGFSKQLLLVERPARLRVEVIGLLEQRVLVLATDGERYELYEGSEFLWYSFPAAEGPMFLQTAIEPGAEPGAVNLNLAFLQVPGSFKVSSYNASGESPLSAGTLIY